MGDNIDRMKSAKLSKLIEEIKSNPDDIVYTEAPFVNSEMLQLLELSEAKSKSEAVQFAVKYTIDGIKTKNREKKLEQLRYAKKETHESSNDLLDTDLANKH